MDNIEESIRLRGKVRTKFLSSTPYIRKLMACEALRFVQNTMGMSTVVAEKVWLENRLPMLGREKERFYGMCADIWQAKDIDYEWLYSMARKYGLKAKAGFVTAFLGDDDGRAVCPDRFWLRRYKLIGDKDKDASISFGEAGFPTLEEVKDMMMRDVGSVENSWKEWFKMAKSAGSCHVPILEKLLTIE